MKGILCFGDSITFGRGEAPSKGWVGRLKEYFGAKDVYNGVYNLGIPGDTSTGLLQRFDAEAKSRVKVKREGDKFLILVAIGTNDCKFDSEGSNPRTALEQFKENIKELVKKAGSYQAEIAFIGLTPVDESKTWPYEDTWFNNDRVKLFNDSIKEVCKTNGLTFLDLFEKMKKEEYKSLLSDGLHPNPEGYNFMFENVKGFLERENLI